MNNGQYVWILSVDWDATMRSSRMPEKVFSSEEKAKDAQKALLDQYPRTDTEVTRWILE